MALVLFMPMLAYRKDFRGMGMVLIGVMPALWWRYLCVQHSIGNDMLTVNVPQTLLHNASEPKHYLMLLWYMFGRNAITLLLPLACYIVMLWKYRAYPSMLAISLFSGLYTGALIFAYFATPYDFLWHLYTSADRVMLPVGLMLGYFSIVILASVLGAKVQSPPEEESPDP